MTLKIEILVKERRGIFKKETEFDPTILPLIIELAFGKENISSSRLVNSTYECELNTSETAAAVLGTISSKLLENCTSINFNAPTHEGNTYFLTTEYGTIVRITAPEEASTENEEEEVDPNGQVETVLEQIKSLIGWTDMKRFVAETLKCISEIRKHNTRAHFMEQNYLVSVNSGCGFTHCMMKLANFCYSLGLFTRKDVYEYVLSDNGEEGKVTTNDIREILENEKNYGDVMTFDISEYMSRDKEGKLRKFLMLLEHYTYHYSFIFRIPYVEPKDLKRIEDQLKDVLLIRTFVVPPYNYKQLEECAERQLNYYDFEVEKDVWPIFDARIRDEKTDGNFYGFRTVNKIVDDMVLTKHRIESEKEEEKRDSLITAKDMAKLSESYGKADIDAFEELDSMVGMQDVAKRLKEIVAQVKLTLKNEKLDRPCMHMRFVGAPGTGKTTVARIVGKIFAKEKLLSNGHFIEHSARDLCGQYIGQTAPKTSEICRDAYGSVLFIDEAYDLYRSTENNDNDFGREALAVLIAEMENHRNDMVVIMAGYKKEMETLMKGNQGLASRMPYSIEFKSYSKKELTDIFMLMAKKHFECTEDLEAEVANFFNNIPQETIDSEEFANARYVRNLYERTWSKASMRIHMDGSENIVLTAADFKLATQDKDITLYEKKERSKVGFVS